MLGKTFGMFWESQEDFPQRASTTSTSPVSRVFKQNRINTDIHLWSPRAAASHPYLETQNSERNPQLCCSGCFPPEWILKSTLWSEASVWSASTWGGVLNAGLAKICLICNIFPPPQPFLIVWQPNNKHRIYIKTSFILLRHLHLLPPESAKNILH